MELIKKGIKMSCIAKEATSQVSVDDDFILGESKPDIDWIINEAGTIYIDEIRPSKDRVAISGNLSFDILYFNDESHSVHSMSGSIPFKEYINIDSDNENEDLRIRWDIDDLAIRIVNSRKISVRAIMSFLIKTTSCRDLDVLTQISGDDRIYTLQRDITYINLLADKKDSMRIKEEIQLEKNKPDILEILWKNINIRNIEVRPMPDVLKIKGELLLFILYKGEEDELVMEWQETVIPFLAEVEMPGIDENVIPNVSFKTTNSIVDAKPDENGENRVIMVDLLSELEIKIYNEENTQVIDDVYSTTVDIKPEYENAEYEELLINNSIRSKFDGMLRYKNEEAGILQFIFAKGDAKIDDISSEDGILTIEGAIITQIMYVSHDDMHPFGTIRGEVPFTLTTELTDTSDEVVIDVNSCVEQIYASVADDEHINVRGNVSAGIFARKKRQINMITTLNDEPYDNSRLITIPGITGYVVKKDDTLWKIAKEHHSSVDSIKEVNGISGDHINTGDRIIVVRIS